MIARGLPGQPDGGIPGILVGGGRPAQIGLIEERRGGLQLVEVISLLKLLVPAFPVRAEEPQPISPDRPAERQGDVVVVLESADVAGIEIAGSQFGVDVVGFQARAGIAVAEPAREPVAAIALDDVQLHAAGVPVRAHAVGLDDDFLKRRLVEDEDAVGNADHLAHAVDDRFGHRCAMQRVGELRGVVDAADAVLCGRLKRHARNNLRQAGETAGGRQRFQRLARELRLLPRALDVDERRFARDRDGFFQRADGHAHVHRRGEVRRQRQAVVPERAEARQRERHRVIAGTQVHQTVEPLAVSEGDTDLLDQRRAGGFDGDAGQHRTGGVTHNTCDSASALRRGFSRPGRENEGDDDCCDSPNCHLNS